MRSEAKRGTRLELVGIPQNISSHFPWGKNGVCAFFFFFFCVDGVPPDAFVFRRNNSGTLLQQATRESFAIIDSYTVVGVNLD